MRITSETGSVCMSTLSTEYFRMPKRLYTGMATEMVGGMVVEGSKMLYLDKNGMGLLARRY